MYIPFVTVNPSGYLTISDKSDNSKKVLQSEKSEDKNLEKLDMTNSQKTKQSQPREPWGI